MLYPLPFWKTFSSWLAHVLTPNRPLSLLPPQPTHPLVAPPPPPSPFSPTPFSPPNLTMPPKGELTKVFGQSTRAEGGGGGSKKGGGAFSKSSYQRQMGQSNRYTGALTEKEESDRAEWLERKKQGIIEKQKMGETLDAKMGYARFDTKGEERSGWLFNMLPTVSVCRRRVVKALSANTPCLALDWYPRAACRTLTHGLPPSLSPPPPPPPPLPSRPSRVKRASTRVVSTYTFCRTTLARSRRPCSTSRTSSSLSGTRI